MKLRVFQIVLSLYSTMGVVFTIYAAKYTLFDMNRSAVIEYFQSTVLLNVILIAITAFILKNAMFPTSRFRRVKIVFVSSMMPNTFFHLSGYRDLSALVAIAALALFGIILYAVYIYSRLLYEERVYNEWLQTQSV